MDLSDEDRTDVPIDFRFLELLLKAAEDPDACFGMFAAGVRVALERGHHVCANPLCSEAEVATPHTTIRSAGRYRSRSRRGRKLATQLRVGRQAFGAGRGSCHRPSKQGHHPLRTRGQDTPPQSHDRLAWSSQE